MRKLFMILPLIILFCFVANLYASSGLVQGEEEKPSLYFVQEFVVKPDKIADFEIILKESASLYTKHNLQYSYFVCSMDNYHYAAYFPINNYGEIDLVFLAFYEVFDKVGEEKIQEMHKRHGDAIEHQKSYFIRHSPELSYASENPRLKPDEANFMYMPNCYVKPGNESEFEEIAKEWVALDKSVNRTDSYDMFVGDIGTETPLYFWLARAKSAADFYNQQEVYGTKAGEKIMELWNKTMALCRKYDEKTGMFRPDLSYMPKGK
jgi:hypothetical protein